MDILKEMSLEIYKNNKRYHIKENLSQNYRPEERSRDRDSSNDNTNKSDSLKANSENYSVNNNYNKNPILAEAENSNKLLDDYNQEELDNIIIDCYNYSIAIPGFL